jgi:hypothetical protein
MADQRQADHTKHFPPAARSRRSQTILAKYLAHRVLHNNSKKLKQGTLATSTRTSTAAQHPDCYSQSYGKAAARKAKGIDSWGVQKFNTFRKKRSS